MGSRSRQPTTCPRRTRSPRSPPARTGPLPTRSWRCPLPRGHLGAGGGRLRRALTGVRTRGEPLPRLLVVPGAIGALFLALPLAGLLWAAPWGTSSSCSPGRPAWRRNLRLSLVTATAATAASFVVGVPLLPAGVAARPGAFSRPRALVRALVTGPLGLPPVVGGGGAAAGLRPARAGREVRSTSGPVCRLPFTTAGVVVAEDVRGHAVPHRSPWRGRCAPIGPAAGGRRRDARRQSVAAPAPGHPAGDRTLPPWPARYSPGPRARRVRGDDHLRRQLPGPAPRRCRSRCTVGPGDRPGRARSRAEPRCCSVGLGHRPGGCCATAGSAGGAAR